MQEIDNDVPTYELPVDADFTQDRRSAVSVKLVQLMQLVGVVPKDRANDYHHYKYASASATMEKVQQGLIKLGLSVTEEMSVNRVDMVSGRDERQHPCYTVKCTLTVRDSETGDEATTAAFGSGMDTADKGIMKAQTAARKYAWWGLLCVGTPDDPEGDTETDAVTSASITQPKSITTADGDQVTQARILSVERSADNRPFEINTSEGLFKTFDKGVAAAAEICRTSDLVMEIRWRPNPNPKYNDRLIVSEKKGKE